MKTNINAKALSLTAAAIGVFLLAAPAYATCGVNGYWGSECGPQTPSNPGNTTNTVTGGDSNSTATGVGVGVGVGVGTGGNGYGGQGGAGGSATATGGSVTGSGNSSSDSSAVAGVAGSGNSRVTNSTTVNNTNKTRIKHAASMAAPVMMGGYGPGNCFGDTNPSGQFGASIQTFGWGVTANRSKASNICAAYAIAGPQGAIGYLAQQDPSFRSVAIANGWAVTKSQAAKQAANASKPAANQRITCPADHPNLREVRGELRCYR